MPPPPNFDLRVRSLPIAKSLQRQPDLGGTRQLADLCLENLLMVPGHYIRPVCKQDSAPLPMLTIGTANLNQNIQAATTDRAG